MSNIDPRYTVSDGSVGTQAQIDQGLRSYMLGVYNMMALGVALTGIIAYLFGNTPALTQMLFSEVTGRPTILYWVAMLSPIGLVLLFSFGFNRLSAPALQLVYWAYAALVGVSISTIFLAYDNMSIVKTFFITSAMFASLSLWGYTTKKDLSGWGTFLFMGLIGLIIASLANLFFKSGPFGLIISIIGVLLFAGLTAYDTQKIKSMYWEADDGETRSKKITSGTLSLYMDFINLFMYLLRLFGSRD
jgi:uncharacterized protein